MSAILAKVSSTTIMADEALLAQLRAIAKKEGISLGEVMRQGLEWRAKLNHRPPSFVGKAWTPGGPHDVASHVDELVAEHLLEKQATIATLDHRHFSVVKPAHCEAFTLVP